MLRGIILSAAVACLTMALPAAAADYPEKPVHIIVPYAPGGPVDLVARTLGQKLSERWKKPVVVENRAGAGSAIGSSYVARAKPDGYTLLVNTSAMLILPFIDRVEFDPVKDFSPIAKVGFAPALLLVNPRLNVHSVSDLIKYGKAHPGELNYASPGTGTSLHLASAMFCSLAGIKATHVPYKGGAVALPQLVAGETQFMFDPITDSRPFVSSGKLRAIAVSTAQRSPLVPDLPTVAESGLPGYDFSVSYGVFGPKSMPASVQEKLNKDIAGVLADSSLIKILNNSGIAVAPLGPKEFLAEYQAQQHMWDQAVSSAGLKK